MKRKILYGIVAIMCATIGGVKAYDGLTQNNMSALMVENIEALTNDENIKYLPGRWRTVGYGSVNFIDWKTYCYPHDFYINCPNKGNCTGTTTIIGCDGK